MGKHVMINQLMDSLHVMSDENFKFSIVLGFMWQTSFNGFAWPFAIETMNKFSMKTQTANCKGFKLNIDH